jgi:hypothetical protein
VWCGLVFLPVCVCVCVCLSLSLAEGIAQQQRITSIYHLYIKYTHPHTHTKNKQILDYLPPTPSALLPFCFLNQTWRRHATADKRWLPICKQTYGRFLLDRLGITTNIYSFFLQRQRARYHYTPLLPHPPTHIHTPIACTPPPEAFFAPYTWILEVHDGRRKGLVYAAAIDMAKVEDRGRMFTSAGNSIVGDGLR